MDTEILMNPVCGMTKEQPPIHVVEEKLLPRGGTGGKGRSAQEEGQVVRSSHVTW